MGRLLTPYRAEFLDLIARSSPRVIAIPQAECRGVGPVNVHLRQATR